MARRRSPPATKSKTVRRPPARGTLKRAGALAQNAERALAANRRKGEDALALIARRMTSIAESFYDIGQALRVLQQKAVYTALGHRSFDELLAKRNLMSRSLAYELVRTAARYTRETAVALGREKANALLAYVDATPAEDVAETLARSDARIGATPISTATAEAIEQAARTHRAKKRSALSKQERAEEREAARAARELAARARRIDRGATAAAERREGTWWVVLRVSPAHASRVVVR
jgi:hypothetical protein